MPSYAFANCKRSTPSRGQIDGATAVLYAQATLESLKVISIGDYAIPGDYVLHSRFERVLNFERGDGCGLISLVSETVGDGPGNIVLDDLPDLPERSVPALLTIGEDRIMLESRSWAIPDSCFYDSKLQLPERHGFAGFRHRWASFKNELVRSAPEKSLIFLLEPAREAAFRSRFDAAVVARFKQAAEFIRADTRGGEPLLERGLALVQRLGWGLTPSGDDFIAGLLLGAHVVGELARCPRCCCPGFPGFPGFHDEADREWLLRLVRAERKPANGISGQFQTFAANGRLCWRWKALFETLFGSAGLQASDRIEAATRRILEIGSSSGADTAAGVVLAIERGMKMTEGGRNGGAL